MRGSSLRGCAFLEFRIVGTLLTEEPSAWWMFKFGERVAGDVVCVAHSLALKYPVWIQFTQTVRLLISKVWFGIFGAALFGCTKSHITENSVSERTQLRSIPFYRFAGFAQTLSFTLLLNAKKRGFWLKSTEQSQFAQREANRSEPRLRI